MPILLLSLPALLTASVGLISPAVPIPPSDSVLCSCYLKLNLAISWQPLPWLLPAPHTTAPLVSQELQSCVCHVLPLACLQWIKDKSSMWTHTCISKNEGKVMALENEGHCKFAGWKQDGVFSTCQASHWEPWVWMLPACSYALLLGQHGNFRSCFYSSIFRLCPVVSRRTLNRAACIYTVLSFCLV